MRQTVFSGFLGFVLAGSAALVACGDGNDSDGDDGGAPPVTVVKSGEGESCGRTDDCEAGLACFNLTCVDDPTPAMGGTGGTSGAGGGGRSGSGGSANPGRLSGSGESCTKTSDCEPSLSCYNLRCLAQPMGEGGDQNMPDPPPVLGGQGETCVLTSDCQPGLSCMPSGGQLGSVGVCTPRDSELEPTGKSCSAECADDEDCCELPVEEHANLGAKSCSELATLLEGVDCEVSVDPVALRRCFAQTAYCSCDGDDNRWACEAGSCVYEADCSASDVVPDGCPQYTRSGRVLSTVCDLEGSEKCSAPAACEEDADCATQAVADDPSDVCAEGECVCHEARCLRPCDRDLDCAAGKVCDDDSQVCVPSGACSSDAMCQRLLSDTRARCTEEDVCTLSCVADVDCNALTGGTLMSVCSDGSCVALGCDSDDECQLMTDPEGSRRRMFCAEPGGGGSTGSSAITD